MIGVIGGMGPMAGVDLVQKIVEETAAVNDRDHLPVVLWSNPKVPDRTAFIRGDSTEDPVPPVRAGLEQLGRVGVSVAGIACNTMHAPQFFEALREASEAFGVELLHIADVAASHLCARARTPQRVGVLSTLGTYKTQIYERAVEERGMECVPLSDSRRRDVHDTAIYSESVGLKAVADAPTDAASSVVLDALSELKSNGADAVVLGCTELPLLFRSSFFRSRLLALEMQVVDPTRSLARALISAFDPKKLRSVPFDAAQ